MCRSLRERAPRAAGRFVLRLLITLWAAIAFLTYGYSHAETVYIGCPSISTTTISEPFVLAC